MEKEIIEKEPLKFQIKVIERNDGTKMYHPQVLCLKNKKEIWVGFASNDKGLIPTFEINGEYNGNGCTDDSTKTARKAIEQYKIDYEKRKEFEKSKIQDEFNKATKNITYIDLP